MGIVVLISGSGTNLQALIDSFSSEISHVISSSSTAYGLVRAQKANPPIPTTVHNLKKYLTKNVGKTRQDFDVELANIILEKKPKLVVLAGWMLILSDKFLKTLNQASPEIPVINLHPALPGEFPGTKAIERAWKAGKEEGLKRTGVMVHYVVEEVDAGEPIVVKEVALKKGESLEDLEKRVHETEWKAIVEGTGKVLEKIKSQNQ